MAKPRSDPGLTMWQFLIQVFRLAFNPNTDGKLIDLPVLGARLVALALLGLAGAALICVAALIVFLTSL